MATASATVPSKPRPRLYRRYVTSALHQRFVHASGLSLLLCWITAFWLGKKDSYFWSWFPISWTGLRALLFFGCCLAIFILQVASLHLGRRVSYSPFTTFYTTILNFTAVQIVFWYLFSAWWFSEVYIWFTAGSDDLGWILKGKIATPDRLNERPLYLRSVFLMLAICQAAVHLYHDYSAIHLPISSPSKTPTPDSCTHHIPPVSFRLKQKLPRILRRCAITSATLATSAPFIYALFLRRLFWSWHVSFAKLIYNLPRSEAKPSGYPPSRPSFMLRSFFVGVFLSMIWEVSSSLFAVFMAQAPLKKDQPLSSNSRDANGTLITGLNAKRDVVKMFAFWELVIISQDFIDRRKAIFADIEREEGPAWTQMLNAALDVVQGISARIEAQILAPKKSPEQGCHKRHSRSIDSLPQIAPPIKTNSIYANPPPPQTRSQELELLIEHSAQRIGQSKNPFQPSIPETTDVLKYVSSNGITPEDVSRGTLTQYAQSYMDKINIGWIFRTSFERRASAVIIGSPHANAALIVDAIEAITRMLIRSLSEDIYGTVISGVPRTVRTFSKTIQAIESFVQCIKQDATRDSDIGEVEVIFARLKAGLAELLSAFQLYLTDQGLSAVEHRSAQNASRPGRLLYEPRAQEKVQDDLVNNNDDGNGNGIKGNNRENSEDMGRRSDRRKFYENDRQEAKQSHDRKVDARKRGTDDHPTPGQRRPSQQRLGTQESAIRRLFPDVMYHKEPARREMEMVR